MDNGVGKQGGNRIRGNRVREQEGKWIMGHKGKEVREQGVKRTMGQESK